ncbi:hypothetical protein LIER_27127 [Lithospermum erythrorhizon]|uniref:Uncharacterized protein n=1 Tax=Lithospermum erythrorhizon TaxID=34254 RepID=A0AAV3RAX9_LITER
MGFLERIWDETIAGPTPDSGLGKLRKYNSFSASSSKASSMNDQMPISRCIVLKNNYDSGSMPSSPLGSSTHSSPFSRNSSNISHSACLFVFITACIHSAWVHPKKLSNFKFL